MTDAPSVAVTAVAALVLLGFVAAFLLVSRLAHHQREPASPVLSFASGVAVAYVLLQVLPELEHHRRLLGQAVQAPPYAPSGPGLYLVALGGLAVFYVLERWLRDEWVPRGGECTPEGPGFWAHLAAFSLYAAFFSHQLHRYAEGGVDRVLLHGSALTLHFLTASNALHRDYGSRYDPTARWALALAACAGWLAGFAGRLPPTIAAIVFAFLAGGILLNVLKEELPGERSSRIAPLLLGIAGYAALVAAVGQA
jgi:hypothetical protein